MALTEAQIVDLSKMIGENYVATRSALPVVTAALTAPEVTAIEADLIALITAWNTDEVGTNALSLNGDGLSLEANEERRLYSSQARVLLGLSPLSVVDSLGGDGMQYGFLRGPCW